MRPFTCYAPVAVPCSHFDGIGARVVDGDPDLEAPRTKAFHYVKSSLLKPMC